MTPIPPEQHHTDFTREVYRRLLRNAILAWPVHLYPEIPADGRILLWRHDCDYSMHAARSLARIEQEEGLRATYFLRMRSEMYNLMEADVMQCVHEIRRLGHALALHFDHPLTGITREDDMVPLLERDRRLLEQIVESPVEVFSFHNPAAFALSCRKWTYGGLINTYAECFQSSIAYCSDSNGYWRHQRLPDVIETVRPPRLQVLTHPEWWTPEAMQPRQRIQRCLDGRASRSAAFYDDQIARDGRSISVEGATAATGSSGGAA